MRSRAHTMPAESDAASAAIAVRTLAVLVQAGAAPHSAWRHLAETGQPEADRVVARVDDGAELVAAIAAEGDSWRDIAAAWDVATTVGAPLSDVLRSFAETLHDSAATADEVRVALSEPAGTARLMVWLPAAGLLLGLALGFDTVGVIFTTLPGAMCVGAGLGLVLLGRWWTRRLLLRARPLPGTPGLHAELFAVALSGGASIERARRLVADVAGAADAQHTDQVLALSQSAGVPAVELLRASAAHARHATRVNGRVRAAALSTQLLLPLGACTLPAFLLLGVAPLILSVLGSTPLLPGS